MKPGAVRVLALMVVLACAFAVHTAEAAKGNVRQRNRHHSRSAPAKAPEPPSPSWKCRVCEDVVQTWHDRFKCAGSSLAMEASRPNPFSPKAESTPFQSCRQPRLDCHDLNEHLKPVCIAMRYQFITRKEKQIWSGIMNKGDVYDTCITLGKCLNDTEQTDAKVCRDSFKGESCRDHVTCAPVQKACSSSCFLCYHLVRDWPLFQQTCKPEGAKVDAEAHLDEEKAQLKAGDKPKPVTSPPKPTFIESWAGAQRGDVSYAEQQRRRQIDQELKRRADDLADRLAGPFGVAPSRPGANRRSDYFDEDLLTFIELDIFQDMRKTAADAAAAANSNPYDSMDDAQAEVEEQYRAGREERRARADAAAAAATEHHRQLLMEVAARQAGRMRSRMDADPAGAAAAGAGGAAADEHPPKIPVQNSDTLPLKCHDMWDSIRYSKKARYFVQWKEEVCITPSGQDRMSSAGLWDANVVCKCLGHCELSQFEYLGLEDVCRYGPPEQRTMDMALGAFMREKPHTAVSKANEEEDEHAASGGDD